MALRLFRQIITRICTSALAVPPGSRQQVQRGQTQSQQAPSAGSASLRTRLWRTAAAMLSISLASLTPALQAQLARYDTPGVYRYTVPSGYKELEITIAGAGGGRGADDPGFNGSAGGAGGPGSLQRFKIKAIPGLVLEFVVGHPGENGVFAPHTEYRRALGGLTGDGQKRGGLGGLGYDKNGLPTAGGGGGGAATFVRVVSSPQIYRNRLLSVAGGGGGGQGGIDNDENYRNPVVPGYWIPTHYINKVCALETHGSNGLIFSGRNRGSGGGGVGMGQSWYTSINSHNPPVFVHHNPEEGWGRASDFPAAAGKPAESGGVCVATDLPDGISSYPVLPLVTQVYGTPTPTPIDTRSYHGNNGERSGWVNIGNVGGDPPPPPGGAGPKLKIGMISNDVGGSFRFTGDNGWQPSTITTKANVLTWSQQQTLASNSSATRIQPGFMDKWDIIGLSCFIRGGAELNLQRFPDGSWEIPTSGVQSNKEIECLLSASERSKAQSAKFKMTLTSVNATGRVNFSVDNGIGDFSISTVRADELVSGPERPISKAGTAIKFNWSAPADWSVPGQNDLKCMDTMGASNGNGLQYFLPLQQGLKEIPADMVKPDSSWVCHLKMTGPKPKPPPPQENSPKLRIGVLSTDAGGSFAFNGDNGWQRSVVTTQPNTLAWSAQQSLSKANTITRIRPEFMDSWNINTLTCSVRGGSNIDVQRFEDGGWDIPASALQSNKEIDCQLGVTEKPKAEPAKFRMTLTSVNATGRVNFSVDNGIGDFSISTLRSDELVSGPERPIGKAGTAIKFNWSAPADWSVPGQNDLKCMDTMGASNGNGLQYFLPLQQGLREIPADMVKPDSSWVCHLKMTAPKPPPPPVKGVRLVLELITKNGVGIFEFAGTNGWNTINIQATEPDKPVSSAIQTLAAANTDILLVPKSPEPQSNWTFHSAAGSCSSSDVSVGQFTPNLSGNLLLIEAKYVKTDALIRCSLTASKKPEKSTQLRLKLKRLGTANGSFSISGDNGWQTWQQDGPQDEVISEYQFLPAGQPLKLTLATEPAGGIIKNLSCLDENAVNSNNPPDSFNPTLIEQNSWQLAAFYMKPTAQFTCSVGIEYPLPLLKPATLSLRAIATGARAAQALSFEYTGSNGWQARSFATSAADLPSDADVQQLTQAITTTLTLVKDQGWSLKQVECLDSNAANSGNTSLKFEPQVMNGSWFLPAPYIKPGAELMCDMTHRYAGYPLRGFVLHDNGIGGGTAHDGRRNGQEAGMAKMPVSLDNCRGLQFDHALSNAMGEFVLDAGLAEPGQVCLRQHLPDALSLVSVQGGTTDARYDAGSQAMTFILKPKSSYQDVLFGNVSNSLLVGSGQQQIPAGKSVSYAHIYTAASTASVRFSAPYTADAAGNPGWQVSLMLDHNCNAVHDAADQPVQAAQVFQVTAGQQICLLQRVQSPVQALPAKRYFSTLVATESLSPQAGSGLREILRELRTDNLTEISNAGESLKLSKQVRQVGGCPSSAADTNPFTTSNQVIPGAFVEYLLSYRNVSDQPLRSLLIADAVPAYTVFKYAGYDSLAGTGLAGCDIRQPAKDTEGTISWAMIDDAQGQAAGGIGLQPGMGGAVRYCVQVLR